jgi:hypothetical protein
VVGGAADERLDLLDGQRLTVPLLPDDIHRTHGPPPGEMWNRQDAKSAKKR